MNLPAMVFALCSGLNLLFLIWFRSPSERDMEFVRGVILCFPVGLIMVLFFQFIWPLFFGAFSLLR